MQGAQSTPCVHRCDDGGTTRARAAPQIGRGNTLGSGMVIWPEKLAKKLARKAGQLARKVASRLNQSTMAAEAAAAASLHELGSWLRVGDPKKVPTCLSSVLRRAPGLQCHVKLTTWSLAPAQPGRWWRLASHGTDSA